MLCEASCAEAGADAPMVSGIEISNTASVERTVTQIKAEILPEFCIQISFLHLPEQSGLLGRYGDRNTRYVVSEGFL
jgi:hypothetical protein